MKVGRVGVKRVLRGVFVGGNWYLCVLIAVHGCCAGNCPKTVFKHFCRLPQLGLMKKI
jgi:hypothetical protein